MILNRTDLAVEAYELCGKSDIVIDEREENGIRITSLCIDTEEKAKQIGKPCGSYITISAPELLYDTGVYTAACEYIAKAIRRLANTDVKILVTGLGNRAITPDALGPEVVSRVFVTNHIKQQLEYDFVEKLGNVSAIAPGVLGTTGMESARIIRGIVKEQKPDLVIAVDAYAARTLERISTTVQISDSGIIPGGGVGNRRAAINREALGVPVVAIGVPTVVDAVTVAADITGSNDAESLRRRLGNEAQKLVVTPKDIDLVIDRCSKTVANGINLAAHHNLTMEEIESYIG